MYDSKIDFVLVANVEGLNFHFHRSEGIKFTPASDCGLSFTLVPTDPANDASGHRIGLTCKAYLTYTATKDQCLFVDSYNRDVMLRVAEGINLPFKPSGEVLIAVDGSCKQGFSPRLDLCPSDISGLIKSTTLELADHIDRFLSLLRWRQGLDAPNEIVKNRTLYWRVEDGEYPIAPLEVDKEMQAPIAAGILWESEYSAALNEIWATQDITEPLGHALIREAANLVLESPRSAIMIMTAALETAVKMHISHLSPDTAWLMSEIPSPPIGKIFRDYVPKLHSARGQEIDFWVKVKPSITKVEDLVKIRNKVAHTGKIPEGTGPAEDYLILVTDMLYVIDVLNGHEWAKARVSHQLCKALGWPKPNNDAGMILASGNYY